MRDGVEIRRLGSVSSFITELQNLSVASKLRGRLASYDIIHTYNMELNPIVGYLSTREGTPSVASLNSYHFFHSSVTNTTAEGLERVYELVGMPTTGRILRYLMKLNDAFIALSRASREVYHQHGFDGIEIDYVPNMIDPSFELPTRDLTDGFQLLYVGSLSENKGVRYLIEAMSRLPKRYELRIVGDGERKEDLQALTRNLGAADRTTFRGRVPHDQIGQEYASADIFVHPGIWQEPFGRTILEAMLAELPVVCTDIGGPPEIVPTEELICKPADPAAISTAIQRVEELPDDVGERNRRYAVENYSPSVVVPQIVDIYERLVSQ
ncbi:Glycosyltransferase involved in cell wall bisynthesis [Halobellus limi]|nr:Glycosyltransferase involved in cell wall bisynthesis [Halobellus limi]